MLNEKVRKLIKKRFNQPTEIQERVIPKILGGENVLVIASTGMGKTEACMLPIFSKLVEEKYRPITVLYITPLRSLNRDMFCRLFWWADKLDLEIAIRHGDTLQKERAEQRETPPDILITTPETLQAILPGKRMRKHLSNVRFVIIDEVHEIVSSKRGVQLALALERLRAVAKSFQIVALSATIGSESLVAKFFGNLKVVRSEAKKQMNVSLLLPTPTREDKKLEDELLIDTATISRIRAIIELVKKHQSTLIFTNTRQTAEVLSSRISLLDKYLAHDVHHSSLSKEVRIKAEKEFKEQKLKALVSTSSLELGIDIGSVDLVIQYLSPRQVSKLVQRVGRSGHKVTDVSKGVVISDEEDFLESLAIIKKFYRKELEKTKIHENALDVLAHQIIGFVLDEYGLTIDELYLRIKKLFPFRNLNKETFLSVISFLARIGILRVDSTSREIRLRRKAWEYYFENLSTIPDTKQYKVINLAFKEYIGNLDEGFVAEYCIPGNTFVCKGRVWKVIQCVDDKIFVEPSGDIESAIPSWQGELIPVPLEVAIEVGNLLKKFAEDKLGEEELDRIENKESIKKIINFARQQKRFFLPNEREIFVEQHKDFIITHSFFGSLINETLGRYISSFISSKYGVSVKMKTTPYTIILKSVGKVDDVVESLKNPGNIKSLLVQSLEESNLFRWRFIQVAKRFGIVSRNASWEDVSVGKIISFYRGTPIYEETLKEIFLEKLDLKTAQRILNEIKKGRIKIHISKKKLSPLGKWSLMYQFGEYLLPKEPKKEIFKFFKKRLMNTIIMIVCLNCHQFKLTTRVRDVEEEPECPLCGSRLIGIVTREFDEFEKIMRKKQKKRKLNKKEKKIYAQVRRTADLIITYGRKAIMTLAARGVGPKQASRILAKLPEREEDLLRYIFEAEKLFIKTHKYWK